MSNASAKNVNAPADIKKKSQFVEVWKRLCRNKTAVLGLVIVALLTLMAILSPILIDYETQVIKTNYSEALQAPSADHWFGTDEMGRDILLRVMYGSTVSLSIGVVTVAVSLTVGLILGAAAGYYIGMKEAFIRVWVNNVKKSKFQLLQENLIMMDSSRMDAQALEEMFQVIEKKKVKCLVGYSSALGELSSYIQKAGKDCSRCKVRAIIPISETMPEPVRRTLEKQFHCPVRAWYSNEENGIMGLQNEENEGYRIDTETYYYEILKMDSDEPAEPGELGRIVITDLFNYAFPILRYDNGDRAVATRKEKNGRYKLYLDELYGRRSDLIYDCEGKAVTPYIITNNLWDIEGVKQYRFIQEDVKDYTIWLNGDPQKMNQEEILGRIRPYLGEEARIKVELVDEIPVLASGKRKYIENRCEKYKNQTGFCG